MILPSSLSWIALGFGIAIPSPNLREIIQGYFRVRSEKSQQLPPLLIILPLEAFMGTKGWVESNFLCTLRF